MKSYIPAGAGEKMQYIVHPFNDNTIRFVLRYPGHLQADALKQAALALAESVDVLHSSFDAGRFGARWRINAIRAEDCFRMTETDRDPVNIGLEQALESVSPSSPAQIRCVLVQGRQESAVVLLVSHLCADGGDGKYLLKKLCEAYDLFLRDGSCSALHIKNGSRSVGQVYSGLSSKDMLRILKDPRSRIKCRFPYPSGETGEPAVTAQRISSDVMAAAHAKAKNMGATVNDLILTACYHAYAEMTGMRSPVSIMGMMDLRKNCPGGDSQGLCNLSGALSTEFPDGIGESFNETLLSVAAQTRRIKQDPFSGLYGMPLLHTAAKRLPMGILLAVSKRLYGSMSLGMTNIGNIAGSDLGMGGLIPGEGWFGGPVKKKPGLQISAASFDGACSLCVWGYAAEEDRQEINKLLESAAGHIRSFGSNA